MNQPDQVSVALVCSFKIPSINTSRIGSMDLLPDTQNCGLCMCQEYRERFPRHRGLTIPTCITFMWWWKPFCGKQNKDILNPRLWNLRASINWHLTSLPLSLNRFALLYQAPHTNNKIFRLIDCLIEENRKSFYPLSLQVLDWNHVQWMRCIW